MQGPSPSSSTVGRKSEFFENSFTFPPPEGESDAAVEWKSDFFEKEAERKFGWPDGDMAKWQVTSPPLGYLNIRAWNERPLTLELPVARWIL